MMDNKVRGVRSEALDVNTFLASPFPPVLTWNSVIINQVAPKLNLKKKLKKNQALPFPEFRRIQSINDWKQQKNESEFTKYKLTC